VSNMPNEEPMTPDVFAAKTRQRFPASGYDEESSHGQADRLMCEVLRSLGYGEGVDVFENADKWYA
jgi:hypothetical protein